MLKPREATYNGQTVLIIGKKWNLVYIRIGKIHKWVPMKDIKE